MSDPLPLSTESLAKQMERLSEELRTTTKDSSEKRHAMNGAVTGAVMALREAMDLQQNRIVLLEKTAQETTETLIEVRGMSKVVQLISTRLVGDDAFKTTGLVQEVVELKIKTENRLTAVEDEQEDVQGKIKALRIIIWTVGALGAGITWLQSTGFLQFAANGHK